jgi:chromosomal replication initiator protein
VTRDDTEIVSALRTALAGKVGKERFDLWFGASTRLHFDGRVLRIGAPSRFFLDWIRANFRRQLEEACNEIFGGQPALEFCVDTVASESSDKMRLAQGNDSVKQTRPAPAVVPMLQPAATTSRQAPTSRRRFAGLDTFVAGDTNRLAVASAEMAVRQPGQLTPLMFCGPTGVGKTHLLEGIWTATRSSQHKLTCIYLSAEQFTSQFLEALRGSGLPSFRQKYRGVGVLVLDDLQFFVGKRATQVELLHTIDTFMRDGRQLVFAADRSPAELPELGSELISRLSGGLVCRIEQSDYATRLGIVGQMARRMKLQVPGDVQEYIASQLTSHARELSGALCRLMATSESLGCPISLAMAQEALADLVAQNGPAVRLPDIEKAVCEVFGLEPASLQSAVKGKRISNPRMLAMWLARKHTRAALSEIGQFFGRRSHSTVVSAQKRVDSWVTSGQALDLAERRWAVDDAIRQVERRLVAG